MAQALLVWLVLYIGCLAAIGFSLFIVRAVSGRPRSALALMRISSSAAFVLALALWLALILVGR